MLRISDRASKPTLGEVTVLTRTDASALGDTPKNTPKDTPTNTPKHTRKNTPKTTRDKQATQPGVPHARAAAGQCSPPA